MEKSRKYRVLTLVALLLAVVGVSVGFAAFTTTLTINSSTSASVPAGTNNLSSTVTFTSSSKTAGNGTVGAVSGQTWSGSTVTFDSSSRSTTFSAVVSNSSAYNVYLSSMAAKASKITCSGSAVSSDILSSFCSNTTAVYTFPTGATITCSSSSCGSVSAAKRAYKIAAGSTATMTLVVSTKSGTLPDGAITISIPGVTLGFTTAYPSS